MNSEIKILEADGRVYVGREINAEKRMCSFPAEWELAEQEKEPEKPIEGKVKINMC